MSNYLSIFEASDGKIWAANNRGIAVYDNFIWRQLNIFKKKIEAGQKVKFDEDKNGNLFVLANDTLYLIRDFKSKKVLYSYKNKIGIVKDFAIGNANELLLLFHETTSNKTILVCRNGTVSKAIWRESAIDEKNKSSEIIKTSNGNIYFHFKNKILKYSGFYLHPCFKDFGEAFTIKSLSENETNTACLLIENENKSIQYFEYDLANYEIKKPVFAGIKQAKVAIRAFGEATILIDESGLSYLKQGLELTLIPELSNITDKNCVIVTKSSDVWIASVGAINCYNNSLDFWDYLPAKSNEGSEFRSIFVDNKQNLWIGKDNGFAIIYSGQSVAVNYDKINGQILGKITTINQDNEGNIFISSSEQAKSTFKFDGKNWKNIGTKDGFSDAAVSSIVNDGNGGLLFTLQNENSLNNPIFLKFEAGKFSSPTLKNKAPLLSINSTVIESDKIWIGHSKGISRFSANDSKSWGRIGDLEIYNCSKLAIDKVGRTWFTSIPAFIGYIIYDSIYSLPISSSFNIAEQTNDICVDDANNVWFATSRGLLCYSNNELFNLNKEQGIGDDDIKLLNYRDGKLYLVSADNSISVLNLDKFFALPKSFFDYTFNTGENGVGYLIWHIKSYRNLFSSIAPQISYKTEEYKWSEWISDRTVQIKSKYGVQALEVKVKTPFLTILKPSNVTINVPYPFYLRPLFLAVISILILAAIAFLAYLYIEDVKYRKLLIAVSSRLDSFVNSLPFFSLIIDKKGNCLQSFISTENEIGLLIDKELEINSMAQIVPEVFHPEMYRAIAKCYKDSKISSCEFEQVKDKEKKYFEIRFSALEDNYVQGKNIVASIFEITSKKIVENELISAKQNAEVAAKVKMDFLSSMSHEIRTPMNAINGISDLLLDEDLPDSAKESILSIKKSADNLLVVINDILDLSKIEGGKIDIEEIEFRVLDVISQVKSSFQFKVAQKNIKLNLEIDKDLPEILIGDPYRLNQILLNIIGNAVKFTDHGGVDISVMCASRQEEIQNVVFIIKDTGIGIEKENITKIFESFNQESKKITRKYGGSGLGLTISKRLIELQKGTIDVESQPGIGSTFTIEIPYQISKNQTLFIPDLSIEKNLKGLKILIVEDNKMNQVVAKQLLTKWKAEVAIAEDGIEALKIMREDNFNLILMDLQMPNMDGYETTKIIRSNTFGISDPNVPIIALTADAIPEVRKKAFSVGMNDFITKPFNQDELFIKISKHAYQLD